MNKDILKFKAVCLFEGSKRHIHDVVVGDYTEEQEEDFHDKFLIGIHHLYRDDGAGWKVLRFTGRKDTLGHDIYEGFIVRHRLTRIWKTQWHISQVMWDQDWHSFYLFDGVSKHRMRDDAMYEIIGNTHSYEYETINHYLEKHGSTS